MPTNKRPKGLITTTDNPISFTKRFWHYLAPTTGQTIHVATEHLESERLVFHSHPYTSSQTSNRCINAIFNELAYIYNYPYLPRVGNKDHVAHLYQADDLKGEDELEYEYYYYIPALFNGATKTLEKYQDASITQS